MRKTGLILLSFFYLLVASGFTLSLHYCAGKLKGVEFYKTSKDVCCGTIKHSKSCCKQKTIVYQIKDNHKSAGKITIPNTSLKDITGLSIDVDYISDRRIIRSYILPNFHAPPFTDSNPTYLLNRNFRI